MTPTISHTREEETSEAKARWFQSLPLSERMELLCMFTDMILTASPDILEQKDAQRLQSVFASFQGFGLLDSIWQTLIQMGCRRDPSLRSG